MRAFAPHPSAVPRESHRTAGAPWVVPLVLGLAVFATRAIWLGDPAPDFDEQLYSLIGQRMAEGALPYADLWDRKPVGLFALFALAHWIGGPSALAYQALGMAFTFAGSLTIFALARPFVASDDRWGALLAAIAYPLLLPLYGSHSGQSEAFFLPLLLGALLLVSGGGTPLTLKRAVAAMLLGGLALQVKYTALPVCAVLGALALARMHQAADWRATIRRAVLFAAIGIVPTALAFAIFAALGEGQAFWWANFQSFFAREAVGRWRTDIFIGLLPLAQPALIGLWMAQRVAPPCDPRLYAQYVAFAAASVAMVFLPGTTYLYYLAGLVPAAILLGLPLFAQAAPPARTVVLLLFASYAAFFVVLDQAGKSAERRVGMAHLTQAIAPLVDRDAACLWIFDGPTALYRTADSCVPTRFLYPDHLNNALETDAIGPDQTAEVARILAGRPPVIVTASEPLTPQNPRATTLVQAALAEGYVPLASAPMDDRTISAWRLR